MKVISESGLEELSRDAGIISIRPRLGYAASTEDEVSEVVERAWKEGIPLTPRGGGTSIPSQSIGSGIVLLQERSKVAYSPGGSVTCEPGVVKADLNAALEHENRWMPVDPSSYRSCTVGGMVSNNSSGIRTPRYGSTIDFVTELSIVVPGAGTRRARATPVEEASHGDKTARSVADLLLDNQTAIERERPSVTKNSSGYRLERGLRDGVLDLPRLLTGSEGTLGVITEVTLSTAARPESRVLCVVEVGLEELDSAAAAFREHDPTAIELVDKSVFRRVGREDLISKYSRTGGDYLLFCEFEGSEAQLQAKLEQVVASKASGYEPLVLQGQSEVAEAWNTRNETLSLAMGIREGRRTLLPGVEDLVVPPDRLSDLVKLLKDQFERRGLTYISYGHAGDANLHARPLLDPDLRSDRAVLEEIMEESFERVWAMGGSMTGEHGDGMLRAPFVEKQYPKTYHLMKSLKEVFDPRGLLNPGVKIAR